MHVSTQLISNAWLIDLPESKEEFNPTGLCVQQVLVLFD